LAAGFCTPRPTIVTLNPGQAELGSGSIGPIAVNLSVALKVTWAIFAIVWIVGAFTSKRSVRRQSWASRFGMIAVAILAYVSLLWAATYFGFADHRFLPDSGIYLWIGLFMTIAGVLFAIWARLTLGRKWSGIVTVKQNHELIRTGPYAGPPSHLHRPHVCGIRNSDFRRRISKHHLNGCSALSTYSQK
jgi:protein-S-isoprenylcysteine O-methyltransferase Ste14